MLSLAAGETVTRDAEDKETALIILGGACTVRGEGFAFEHNDVTLLPEGYHPVVAAPGYKMYYLWIMAGVQRKFISIQDPAHRWVAQG